MAEYSKQTANQNNQLSCIKIHLHNIFIIDTLWWFVLLNCVCIHILMSQQHFMMIYTNMLASISASHGACFDTKQPVLAAKSANIYLNWLITRKTVDTVHAVDLSLFSADQVLSYESVGPAIEGLTDQLTHKHVNIFLNVISFSHVVHNKCNISAWN